LPELPKLPKVAIENQDYYHKGHGGAQRAEIAELKKPYR
jgi:hypothetical protein